MATKAVLISADNSKQAVDAVSKKGGLVGLALAPGIFAAVVPQSFTSDDAHLSSKVIKAASKDGVEDTIDPFDEFFAESSDYRNSAWELVQGQEVSKTVDRPIPLSVKGHIAVAIVVVSGEDDNQKLTDAEVRSIVASVYGGSLRLITSFPGLNLMFSYDYYHITISPSIEVPHVGATKWPSAVPFQDKLYVFYQGNRFHQKMIMYNTYDWISSSWEGIQQVPSTTITDGPSAVVYDGKLWVFHNGSSVRHEIWYNVFNGTSWAGDARIWNTRITGGPSTLVHEGKIYCFHQGYTENDNELWYNVYDGKDWVGDKLVDETRIIGSPSAVSFNGKIYCFYQGFGEFQNSLLVNRLDPATGVWSGHVKVPYTGAVTDGTPSAVVFDNKIYLFHQTADSGEIWFNTSSDGSLWRGDISMTHLKATDGIGTTVFENQLFMFYQGSGKQIQSLRYRSFDAGTLEWEDLWAGPALQQLGFRSGYPGFAELAEATKANNGADYGYAAFYTPLPIPYSSYADGTRLCIQYPSSDDLSTTFSSVFDSSAIYDKTSDRAPIPRYTFAYRSGIDNTLPITQYTTGFLFHQGKGTNSGTQLWFSLLDRRTGRWAEMQGPVTSLTTGGTAGVFLSYSKLYVFYQVNENAGEMYYNILDGVTWKGEQKVPTTESGGASGSAGATLFQGKLYCFYQGPNKDGTFWVSVLNTETDAWETELQLVTQPDQFDDNGNLIYRTSVTLGPSTVLYLGLVYNLYNGTVFDKGVTMDSRVRFNTFHGTGILTDQQVVNTYLTGKPAAVVYDNKLYCFHQGNKSDGTVWYNISEDGNTWVGDKRFPLEDGLLISDGPAAMALEGKLHCFVKGKGNQRDDKLWHNVLDGDNGWLQQEVFPTGSGVVSQHDALAIGSLAINYGTVPPTVDRVI